MGAPTQFGRGPLDGHAPLKFIYLDEAGTSAKEPVSVVLGVIIDADTQWRLASSKLNEIISACVPETLKSNFISHTKTIFGERDPNRLKIWSTPDRIAFLEAVMALPRQLNMPIAIGVQRRGAMAPLQPSKFSPAQQDHIWAFLFCITYADIYMRNETPEGEVAIAVAEDVDSVRSPIREMIRYLKRTAAAPSAVRLSERLPTVLPRVKFSNEIAVTRVVDSVHFVSKQDGPLLQIADACAFAFRRFFAKQNHGLDFVRAILGSDLGNAAEWDGPCSGQTFMWCLPRVPPLSERI